MSIRNYQETADLSQIQEKMYKKPGRNPVDFCLEL